MFFLNRKTFSAGLAVIFIGGLSFFVFQAPAYAEKKYQGYIRTAEETGILKKIEEWLKDPLGKKKAPQNPYVRQLQ